jgi:hypothetical protein
MRSVVATSEDCNVATASGNLPLHHLFLVVKDNRAHLDNWLLRDLLRADA